MRSTFIVAILAAVIFAAGCGGYDRALLGDPQPRPQEEPQASANAPQEEYEPSEDTGAEGTRDVGMFDELKFYGTWHWLDPYGWVWRPLVVGSWQPLLHGHWIWSQYGWMWVSYDPWGWATAHYGFWVVDFTYGWVWIPEYEWSPCRCDWVQYDDYICWAPVPPSGVRYKDPWDKGGTQWVAVPVGKFKETNVGNHRTTPRFKSGYSDRTLRRSAPDSHDFERLGSKPPDLVEVRLDRTVVGNREFARVWLPPEQQNIVNDQQARMKADAEKSGSKSGSVRGRDDTSPPPPASGNDDTRTKSKSKKDSGSKKDADKKDPPKYKEQKKDDAQKKDSGKKEPKSKGK
jgi:hypothetical protein